MLDFYRLYRYQIDSIRNVETLLERGLWFSKTASLNDPFEFAALEQVKLLSPEKIVLFENAGVACFCRAITNPLLWSHYAAAHTGFSIAYDELHPFFGRVRGIRSSLLHDV